MFHEALERVTGRKKLFVDRTVDGVAARGRRTAYTPGGAGDPVAPLYGSVQKTLYGRDDGLLLHVTAATHGEGVSTIARALGERACVAGHRRVLLLQGFASNHEPHANNRNLVSLIASGSPIEEGIVSVAGSNLMLGTLLGSSGSGAPDPRALHQAYIECRKKFELIIVDCGPTSSGSYSDLIPSAADGIILVVRAETTRPAVVQHCKALIDQRGGVITNVVLNRAKYYIPKIIYELI